MWLYNKKSKDGVFVIDFGCLFIGFSDFPHKIYSYKSIAGQFLGVSGLLKQWVPELSGSHFSKQLGILYGIQ